MNMTNNLLMVNKIKQRMSEIGINAKQLAQKADVGKSFVYDILNGKSKNPTSTKLSSISKHLGIPISYLMNNDDNNINTEDYSSIQSFDTGEKDNPSMLLLSSLFQNIQNTKSPYYSFKISDDSMEPTFHNGDIVIIEKSQNKKELVGCFLIQAEFSTTIRRIEHIIGSTTLRIIADNQKYATYEQDMGNVKLIGKAVYYLRTI